MVKDGEEWSRVVKEGQEGWSRVVKGVRGGQEWSKEGPGLSRIVKNGQGRSSVVRLMVDKGGKRCSFKGGQRL